MWEPHRNIKPFKPSGVKWLHTLQSVQVHSAKCFGRLIVATTRKNMGLRGLKDMKQTGLLSYRNREEQLIQWPDLTLTASETERFVEKVCLCVL